MPKIVAVIPTRNDIASREQAQHCADVLRKQSTGSAEIIIKMDKELGLHRLFNDCIDTAMQFHPEYICIFGSDTIMLTEHWDRRLLGAMTKSTGACHAVMVDEADNILYAGSNEGQEAELIGFHVGRLMPCGAEQPWLSHSAVCISAQALLDVADYRLAHPELGVGKYYSEDYTLFCGDRELSYLLRTLGYKLFVHNGIKVIHAHGGSQTVKKVFPDFMAIARKDSALLWSRWRPLMESWVDRTQVMIDDQCNLT